MKAVKFLGACALAAVLAVGAAMPAAADSHGALTAELQEMVATLSTEQQAALYLLLSQLTAHGVADAEVAAAEEDPEAVVSAGIKTFFEAAVAGDEDAMKAFFSDSFSHFMFGNVSGLIDYMDMARSMGYLDGIEVDLGYAEYKLEDGKMTVYPVDVTGSFGMITFEYVLAQEDGEWKVVGLDVEGL